MRSYQQRRLTLSTAGERNVEVLFLPQGGQNGSETCNVIWIVIVVPVGVSVEEDEHIWGEQRLYVFQTVHVHIK